MNFYLVSSTCLMILGGFMWGRKDIYNAAVRFILLAMGFWGIFLELQFLGYIIRK